LRRPVGVDCEISDDDGRIDGVVPKKTRDVAPLRPRPVMVSVKAAPGRALDGTCENDRLGLD